MARKKVLYEEHQGRRAFSRARFLTLFGKIVGKRAVVDTTAPTVTITCAQTSPSGDAVFNFTFTLSEVSTDFAIGDLTVGNGTAGNFAGSGTSYTADITPTASGAVTVDIAADAFHDAAGNGNIAATQFSITAIVWIIRDDYNDTVAAGAVNGTTATPTGGTRTAADTNSKMSIGSGVLSIATGGAGSGDPALRYASAARGAGKFCVFEATPAGGANTQNNIGFDNNNTADAGEALLFNLSNVLVALTNGGSVFPSVGAFANGTSYLGAVVQRATGMFFFIKGGTFTNWTLLYVSNLGNTTPLYPVMGAYFGTKHVMTNSTYRVPQDTMAIQPIGSDSFNRADGAIGNTDGAAAAEGGGSGLTWATVGTWVTATNKAACSALSGGLGIVTVPCSSINVMVEAAVTRTAGNAGIVLRYQDASNYIYAFHDGTNVALHKVTTAGGDVELFSVATTYSAGKRLIVSANGTAFRVYYNDVLRGTEQTIADAALQTTASHGLYTSDTGNSFDAFNVWAKGNESQYAAFSNFTNP